MAKSFGFVVPVLNHTQEVIKKVRSGIVIFPGTTGNRSYAHGQMSSIQVLRMWPLLLCDF